MIICCPDNKTYATYDIRSIKKEQAGFDFVRNRTNQLFSFIRCQKFFDGVKNQIKMTTANFNFINFTEQFMYHFKINKSS